MTSPVSWGLVTTSALAAANQLALMPDFLDPMKLLGYFGTWALVGLLVVIFVESGVLFPILPGDSLLFVAGMLAAGTAALAEEGGETVNFQLWQLLVFIPIAAILGGQVGYWIGRNIGTAMFKPNAKVLKQKYLDEAHVFFEQRGPFAIVIARFVPIVRTLAPLVAGAARMNYPVFALFNILGAVVWAVSLTLLGYWLGRFQFIQDLLEPIVVAIVVVSLLPMAYEWYKRRKAAKKAAVETAPNATEQPT
jgi:membrane-associated protein